MNRKDFDIIARAVKNMQGDITMFACRRAAIHLCREIKAAEGCSGFDHVKFLKACGVADVAP